MSWIKRIFSVLLLVPSIGSAGVQIYPVRLDLTTAEPIGAFTILNNNPDKSAPDINMNAVLVGWTQGNGQNIYIDNPPDLFLIPLIFAVSSGNSQIIRVSLVNPPDPLQEKAYRVIFKQFTPQMVTIPIKNSNAVANFAIRTDISVPIFVPPLAPKKISARFAARVDAASNTVSLNITNTGNTHIHLIDVKLTNSAGLVAESNEIIYILPGSTMSEKIKAIKPASIGENLTVQLSTDDNNYPELTGNVVLQKSL